MGTTFMSKLRIKSTDLFQAILELLTKDTSTVNKMFEQEVTPDGYTLYDVLMKLREDEIEIV